MNSLPRLQNPLKLLVLTPSIIIFFYLITPSFAIVMAQGGVCSRTDFSYLDGLTPPGPTPIESTQPTLATINQTFDTEATNRNIALWVLKAIANRESTWRQIDTVYPNFPVSSGCNAGVDGTVSDCTCVSYGGDYGIMQINWSAHNGNAGWSWNNILSDYVYNIQRGADILMGTTPPNVNQGDLSDTGVSVNWYLKLWAYNGFSFGNNPSNQSLYNRDRNWDGNNRLDCSNWPKQGLSEVSYTYQEQVLYRAWCQPNVDNFILPSIDEFPLPDDTLFEGSNVPTQDILIFDVQATTPNCSSPTTSFQYTLNPLQFVSTQVVIQDGKPWQSGNVIKTLPIGVNVWDGTNGSGQTVSEGEYWFTVEVRNSGGQLIGSQSGPIHTGCNKLYLPIVFKGDGSSGPGNCQWTVDNLLQDSGFSVSSYWQEINVFVDPDKKPFSTLKALPPVSSPWDGQFAAKLGGVNDEMAGPGQERYELHEHVVFQPATLPNNVEALGLEYSYYLTTFEDGGGAVFDYFFADVQLDFLGSANSLLGHPLEYNDNHSFQDVWRRRGCPVGEPNCDGMITIENVSQYAGDTVVVVFYSEVDTSAVSTFYLDAVKLSACTTN